MLGRLTSPARRPWRAPGAGLAVLGLAALMVAPVAAAAAGPTASPPITADAEPLPEASPSATEDESADGGADGLVLVGTGGLHWTDVDRVVTPTLWRMVGEGSVGSISVRAAGPETCRLDGWLTLSATRRVVLPPDGSLGAAADAAPDGADRAAEDCSPMPEIAGAPDGPGPAEVTGWPALIASAEAGGGTPGTLAARLAATGGCTTAVGPGAAVALADATGRLPGYVPSTIGLDADLLTACPITIVDTGEPAVEQDERQVALRALDRLLADVVEAVPDGWRVVVAGIHDSPVDEAGLQVAVAWRKGGGQVGWLTSDSTRRPGIVTLTDLAATVLADAGGQGDDLEGSPLSVAGERRMTVERTVENRRYLGELTTTVPHLVPVFLAILGLGVLAAGGALLAAWRRVGRAPAAADGVGPDGAAGTGPATRRVVAATLLLAACGPAGAYLAALSRWWGAPAPTVAASLWTAVAVTATALVAWGLSRLLPRGPWRLAAAAAGVTWLVLTVDGLTGTTLQHGSVLGVTATLGARYFGFGNLTFAVYLTAGLVLAGAVAAGALGRGRRVAAPAWVLAIGLVTVVVDGWPTFGADLGGVFAVVPAFALLLLGVVRVAPTPRRILVTALLTVAAVGVVTAVDWLSPGGGSHLGLFAQRLVDGEAWPVVAGKAASAWATVANPLGAPAAVVCLVACLALVGPRRLRPAAVDRAYANVPLLRPVTRSVVVAAALGTLLNDSGIAVGASVLAMAATLGLASWADAAEWPGATDRPAAAEAAPSRPDARLRRMPAVITAVGGGLLGALLLGSVVAPGAPVAAGDVASPVASVVAGAERVVIVGTSGVQWQDVTFANTPTVWRMVRDGAAAGGVTAGVAGANRRCTSAGWLALSAGRAPVTGEWVDGTWACAPWMVDASTAPGGEAEVAGWAALRDLQSSSVFRPRLGVLAEALAEAGVCATAVGPGAALALADGAGEVPRYRDLETGLADPDGTFACPVTVVDAGAAPRRPTTALTAGVPAPDSTTTVTDAARAAAEQARLSALAELDSTVRRVVQAAPPDAVVLVIDVADPTADRPALGIGLANGPDGATARFLSASSTRWEGVVRLLDVPTTVLAAVGVANPPELSGSPVTTAGPRPSDTAATVDQLTALTVRDHALRRVAGSIATLPMLLSLALLGAVVLLGRRTAPASGVRRTGRVIDTALLVVASMPAGLFLMSTWSWWRADPPVTGMWGSLAASTLIVAGLAALAPWRPVWAAPALIGGVTAGLLTLDAMLGTPLHRGSPLGPAVTLGGRYYGFGNPTYSVFVVAAVVATAAVATWLVGRGRRRLAVVVASALAVVTLVVDLWPSLGADIGGGLVLVPVCAVVVLAVAGVHVSWQRLVLIAAAGLVVVGGIGVLDWMRPAEDRSHLGRFVQSVLDGTAWETVARKAGYAADSLTSGPTAWLTLAVVLGVALLLWRGSRVRADWFARVEAEWPLVRPVLLALLLAAVGGAVVNDYGVRIATIMLFAAVPLVGVLAVRSLPELTAAPATALPCEGPAHGSETDGTERSGP